MEFMVVVAAACAGYVAQHLQTSLGDNKDNLLEQNQIPKHDQQSYNSNFLHQVREKVCPFRRLPRKRAQKQVSDEGATAELIREHEKKAECTLMEMLAMESDGIGISSKLNDEYLFVVGSNGENENQSECAPEEYTNPTDLVQPNGMALLFMGITSGLMYAFAANRRETEKLNEKLNRAENMVQQLQEELEMQESFIVKELGTDDGYEKLDLYSPSLSSSCEIQFIEPTRQTSENKTAENHISMSEIEADLEAELERLEMNMKVSTLERISVFVEVDSEDEVDVAQGDLNLDCLDGQWLGSSESDWSTSTEYSKPVKYPVSPRELSLRLHEVLESRLEAQIKKLETALNNSKSKACSLEIQQVVTHKDYVSSESESSTNPQSPYCYHEGDG